MAQEISFTIWSAMRFMPSGALAEATRCGSHSIPLLRQRAERGAALLKIIFRKGKSSIAPAVFLAYVLIARASALYPFPRGAPMAKKNAKPAKKAAKAPKKGGK
jgi:hypothetical protein